MLTGVDVLPDGVVVLGSLTFVSESWLAGVVVTGVGSELGVGSLNRLAGG